MTPSSTPDPRFQTWLAAQVPAVPDDLLDRSMRRVAETPQDRGWTVRWPVLRFAPPIAAAAVVVVAVMAVGVLLGNLPHQVVGPPPSQTSPAPSSTPSPSLYVPGAWQLTSIPTPPGHPTFVVLAASPDASVVLFRDADAYDHVFVARNGAVTELQLPGSDPGTPIAVLAAPSGWSAVLQRGARLWRYDLARGSLAELPPVPEGAGVQWLSFVSDNELVIVEALADTPVHPTQVWTLDLPSGDYAKLGSRTNVEMAFGTERGVMLVVDESPAHDNEGWHVYLADADGSDTLAYDASGETELAVSRDGRYLALSQSVAGTGPVTIVDLDANRTATLAPGGVVRSFSPDGTEVGVETDGELRAYRLDGTIAATIAAPDAAAWVGAPTVPSPAPSPAEPPVRVYNQTSVALTLVVNGSAVAVVPAEGLADPVTAPMPGRPWTIQLQSPSGRPLVTLDVPADDITVPLYGQPGNLACGLIVLAVGGSLPVSEPAFSPALGAAPCA
jgi:hypothetical protein